MIRYKLRKRGPWYHADLSGDGERKRIALATKSRIEAEERIKVIIDRQIHRTAIPLGEMVARFLELAREEKRSWQCDVYHSKRILSYFGAETLLSDINAADVAAFKLELSKAKTPRGIMSHATVNRHLALLKTLYNRAIALDLYDGGNPVRKVRLFQESGRQEYFTVDEIKKLLAASRGLTGSVGQVFPYILAIAVFTGMRLSEILTLQWSSIADGYITVKAEHAKSKKVRYIPIAPALVETLKGLPVSGDYVFPIRKADSIRRAWKRTLKLSGVRPRHFHDLRHSFVTFLLSAGVDPQTVRELAGHSTLRVTGIYAHSDKARKLEAVSKLPEFI